MTTPERSIINTQDSSDSQDSLTSQPHPQKIACDLPRYIDKVDIAITYQVSGKTPFSEVLPIPVTQYFHACKIIAWPSGRTAIGRKVLCTNGRLLIRGDLKLPRLQGKQKKARNENSLSETERKTLSQLCTGHDQPSDVQFKILKDQSNEVVAGIAKSEFPYCPVGEVTTDISISLSALEGYIEVPHPPNA